MNDIATVEDLVSYLRNNFKLDDKLCFWHEGGAWCECEYVHKQDIGKQFLRKLSDEKEERWNSIKEDYPKDVFDYDYRMIDNINDYALIY